MEAKKLSILLSAKMADWTAKAAALEDVGVNVWIYASTYCSLNLINFNFELTWDKGDDEKEVKIDFKDADLKDDAKVEELMSEIDEMDALLIDIFNEYSAERAKTLLAESKLNGLFQ